MEMVLFVVMVVVYSSLLATPDQNARGDGISSVEPEVLELWYTLTMLIS